MIASWMLNILGSMTYVRFDFMEGNMVPVIQASPVKYIKEPDLELLIFVMQQGVNLSRFSVP